MTPVQSWWFSLVSVKMGLILRGCSISSSSSSSESELSGPLSSGSLRPRPPRGGSKLENILAHLSRQCWCDIYYLSLLLLTIRQSSLYQLVQLAEGSGWQQRSRCRNFLAPLLRRRHLEKWLLGSQGQGPCPCWPAGTSGS